MTSKKIESITSELFTEAAIEKAFQTKTGNHFYQFNNDLLEKQKDSLTFNLKLINSTIKNGSVLTVDQYTIVGALAYMFGIDFSSQSYLTKKVCENINNRFKFLVLTVEDIAEIFELFTQIEPNDFYGPKMFMENEIDQDIDFSSLNEPSNFKLKILPGIKNILNNSIVSINFATELSNLKLIKFDEWKFKDLIKVNTLINEHLEFTGKSVKNYVQLYSENDFNELLKYATIVQEKNKFALMYSESILLLTETLSRLNIDTFEKLVNIIDARYTDAEFDEFKFAWEAKEFAKLKESEKSESNEEKPKVIVPDPDYIAPDKGQFAAWFETEPDMAISSYLKDFNKSNILDNNNIFNALDILFEKENAEMLQNFYHYIKAKIKDPNRIQFPEIKDVYGLDFDSFAIEMKDKLNVINSEYKELVEFICQELPENKINRIQIYVHTCIESVILTNKQQKQYLISEYANSGIKTYNQLQQIVNLIEQTKMYGSEVNSYTDLYRYLLSDENISEVFEKSKDIEALENKITLYTGIYNWFVELNPEKDNKTEENQEENLVQK